MRPTPVVLPTDETTIVFSPVGTGKTYSLAQWQKETDVIVRQFDFVPHLDIVVKHRGRVDSWHYILNQWYNNLTEKPHIVVLDNIDWLMHTPELADVFNKLLIYWRSKGQKLFGATMVVLARPESRPQFFKNLQLKMQNQYPKTLQFAVEIASERANFSSDEAYSFWNKYCQDPYKAYFFDYIIKDCFPWYTHQNAKFAKLFQDSHKAFNYAFFITFLDQFAKSTHFGRNLIAKLPNLYIPLRIAGLRTFETRYNSEFLYLLGYIAKNTMNKRGLRSKKFLKRNAIYDKLRKHSKTHPDWVDQLEFRGIKFKKDYIQLLIDIGVVENAPQNKVRWATPWILLANFLAAKGK